MRIGELSKRTGLSRDTIRLYERLGLISALEREGGNNYKSYRDETVITLEIVKDAQAAGLNLADLSIFLSQLSAVDGDGFDGDAFLANKIEEVTARIASSQRFLQTLIDARAALKIAPHPGNPTQNK